MAINQDVKACIPLRKVSPEYFAFAIHALQSQLLTIWRQQGVTVESLDFDAVKATHFVFPTFCEQCRIVKFLDVATAKVDALIQKKRALIEKLREKRSALIYRVVARSLPPEPARSAGLNPCPKLKPSGIDWVADIPEHWRAGKLRRFAQMKTGHTPSRQQPEYWEDCEIPWFTLADVWQLRDETRDFLEDTEEKISHLGLANSAAELLPAEL
jgi:type I restriction enzyme S subunit